MKPLAFLWLSVLAASVFSIRDPAVLKRYSSGSGGGTPLMDTNGLVAWYEFDGDLTDEHTGARDLTGGGSPFYTNDVWGTSAKALRTIASGGAHAYRANEAAFESQQFSVAAWVRFPTDNDAYFFAVHGGTSTGQRSYGLRRQGSTFDRWRITTYPDSGTETLYTAGIGSAADSTWIHVAVIVNANTNISIWVNGVEQSRSTTVSTNIIDSTGRVGVGFISDGGTTYDCEVAQVSYWGRLLSTNSPNEVSILYNSGNELTYQELLGN